MRIGRSIILPAIVALGVAGSAVAGAAIAIPATHATSVQLRADGSSTNPNMFYHG
jgi:ABC-type phosphate transport system substrate-binding protein